MRMVICPKYRVIFSILIVNHLERNGINLTARNHLTHSHRRISLFEMILRNLLRLFLFLGSVSAGTAVIAAKTDSPFLEIKGSIYPKDEIPKECGSLIQGGSCAGVPFGQFHVVSTKANDQIYSRATFADPSGVAVIEETWEKDGKITQGKIENKQLGNVGQVEIRDQKVFYTLTEKSGKKKQSEAKAESNLVMPSTLMSFLRPQFKELLEGKTFSVKMIVLDRLDSYTFNVKKIKEISSVDGKPIVVLQMSPNSFFVRAVVDPLYFYIDKGSEEMIAFDGRSALRRMVKGKLKEFDAQVKYAHLINVFRKSENSNQK